MKESDWTKARTKEHKMKIKNEKWWESVERKQKKWKRKEETVSFRMNIRKLVLGCFGSSNFPLFQIFLHLLMWESPELNVNHQK